MKPLLAKDITTLMERFEYFKDAEFRSCDIISPTQVELIFAVQDKARAYDWITVALSCSLMRDAKLLEASKLHLVNMEQGITLLHEDNFALAIGEYTNHTNITDSVFYIVCENITYKEGEF